jgi:hypothetical protein
MEGKKEGREKREISRKEGRKGMKGKRKKDEDGGAACFLLRYRHASVSITISSLLVPLSLYFLTTASLSPHLNTFPPSTAPSSLHSPHPPLLRLNDAVEYDDEALLAAGTQVGNANVFHGRPAHHLQSCRRPRCERPSH